MLRPWDAQRPLLISKAKASKMHAICVTVCVRVCWTLCECCLRFAWHDTGQRLIGIGWDLVDLAKRNAHINFKRMIACHSPNHDDTSQVNYDFYCYWLSSGPCISLLIVNSELMNFVFFTIRSRHADEAHFSPLRIRCVCFSIDFLPFIYIHTHVKSSHPSCNGMDV